ncbi:hemerythrin domain-containing protein [Kribbella capetownensis]|uniref:Hemerythrin domain-containing protein n=1 Tax=Kribbella capetownensis TaxID=1572659 RepID=A0A4R0JFY5_9ACTN|nr:hemerythrin domain-containing protein [Kribbella capetownensis]
MTSIDVIDVLTADHREVQELANQISATASTDERRELTDQLIAELVRHSVAEEMYVYPAMRDHLPDGEKAVEHDTEEHKELETLMKQLEGADAATTAFEDTLRNLQEVLVDHVQDEETEQFPQLRTSIPAAKLIELKEKVETAKRLAPTRPHPAAPNAELFHKLVGPGVGLVDRLRDKLTGRNS